MITKWQNFKQSECQTEQQQSNLAEENQQSWHKFILTMSQSISSDYHIFSVQCVLNKNTDKTGKHKRKSILQN